MLDDPGDDVEDAPLAVDPSRLDELRRLGPAGECLARRAIASFLDTGPKHLWEINRAVASRSVDALRHEATVLKGIALMVGAVGVAAECRQLERVAQLGNVRAAKSVIPELAGQLALAETAIRQQDEERP